MKKEWTIKMREHTMLKMNFRANISHDINLYSYKKKGVEYFEIWNQSREIYESECNNGFILGFPWESADFVRDARNKMEKLDSFKQYCVYSIIELIGTQLIYCQIWDNEVILNPGYYDSRYNFIDFNKPTTNYKEAISSIKSFVEEQNQILAVQEQKIMSPKPYIKRSVA